MSVAFFAVLLFGLILATPLLLLVLGPLRCPPVKPLRQQLFKKDSSQSQSCLYISLQQR